MSQQAIDLAAKNIGFFTFLAFLKFGSVKTLDSVSWILEFCI
jgi:hypothetical protein